MFVNSMLRSRQAANPAALVLGEASAAVGVQIIQRTKGLMHGLVHSPSLGGPLSASPGKPRLASQRNPARMDALHR